MKINKIFKQVPRIIFGEETLTRLHELLPLLNPDEESILYVIDDVHQTTGLLKKLKTEKNDIILWVDTTHEPTTKQVDELRDSVLRKNKFPKAIVAIGGGSAMDIGKAISVMLTSSGSSSQYQGWDLVKNQAVYKVGIPTLSGTGAEASRTAVLTGPDKKFGINSDQSMFDAIICDSSLLKTVPVDQRFYTAMDCYIHCVESITGTMINEIAKAYASKALDLCRNVFLHDGDDDQLMVASYMGGCSIVNSEVGICHALSYGLSLELGFHHGIANCIAFNVLDQYYGEYVEEMRKMMELHNIQLPSKVCKDISEQGLQRMIEMTLKMEKPLTNALGENWREVFTPEVIMNLYRQM
ncbi:MAG: iron-containing alcohol dehydrogenase [Desulfamplus sp.]|nr:iron-containing alcohol dehydrogenase [Desulfamplus sp.]